MFESLVESYNACCDPTPAETEKQVYPGAHHDESYSSQVHSKVYSFAEEAKLHVVACCSPRRAETERAIYPESWGHPPRAPPRHLDVYVPGADSEDDTQSNQGPCKREETPMFHTPAAGSISSEAQPEVPIQKPPTAIAMSSSSHFQATLERASGEKWNWEIDFEHPEHVQVVRVGDGPVMNYNHAHPEHKIEAGDLIKAVNGEERSTKAMATAIMESSTIVLRVRKQFPAVTTDKVALEEVRKQNKGCIVFYNSFLEEVLVKFTKAPFGVRFKNKLPLVVSKVEGHAEELGVQCGWVFKSIEGVPVKGREFAELKQELIDFSISLLVVL